MLDIDFAHSIQKIAVALIPVVLGLVCHEVAHGWVAWRLGDNTAKAQGRLTLNPLVHLEPMGTLMFVMTALTSPFVLGWARPVPVDASRFRYPAKDNMFVALAGPLANLFLALLFGLLAKLLIFVAPVLLPGSTLEFLSRTVAVGIYVNVTLALFNMLPIPPLDGSYVLRYLLPPKLAWQYYQVGRYGFIIILVLLISGVLGRVLWPLVEYVVYMLFFLLGLA